MVFGESPLKDIYRRLVWGPGRELLERAPYGWEYAAWRRIGSLVGHAAAAKRAEVIKNLRRAFPDRDTAALEHIAVQTFATHFVNQYASFAFGRIAIHNWTRWLRFEGLHHIWAARAAGQGVVLMHPHTGPAQLPLCVLGVMGLPVHQIGGGEPAVEKSEIGRWATAERHRLEARMPVTLHSGQGYLRSLVRALQAGEIVLTACDGTGGGQELGRRLVRTVLGQPMRLPVGAWYLAARGEARLHPMYCVVDPEDKSRYLARILPAEEVGGGRIGEVLERGGDRTAEILGEILGRYPGDWLFWDAFRPGDLLDTKERRNEGGTKGEGGERGEGERGEGERGG